LTKLDAALASHSRDEAALRLRLGQALEASSHGACFELGFSSLSGYALERCDRSVRWVEAARCLARRVEGLPGVRQAIASGGVSWSMAALIAGVARPEDEAGWLEAAQSRTVRQMRVLVAQAVAARDAGCPPVAHAASAVAAAAPEAVANDVPPSQAGGCGDAPRCDHALGSACADEPARWNDEVPPQTRAGDCTHAPEWDCAPGAEHGEETRTLTCTVTQEDAWLFEATRLLLGQLGVHGSEALSEALLAEGQGTLLGSLPEGALALDPLEDSEAVQQRWERRLVHWRVEAEASCEGRFCGSLWSPARGGSHASAGDSGHPGGSAVAAAAAQGMASLKELGGAALDGHVRDLSRALARHELEVSRLVLRFYRANGWRRLGYATEGQYARERLGMSLSALRARRTLALRLQALPRVAEALGAGHLGVEAALQVVRIATAHTEAAWVERARRRTIKHLREEVGAALVAVRCSGELDCPPPEHAELLAFHELEQVVVSGRAVRGAGRAETTVPKPCGQTMSSPDRRRLTEPTSEERRAWFVMLRSLASWLESGLQMSAAPSGVPVPAAPTDRRVGGAGARTIGGSSGRGATAGRVALRLRMSRSTFTWWRQLERQAQCWLPAGMSWLRFLCLSLWQAWQHLLGAEVAYAAIYARDRYRCTSPVCSRRDVTPHHIVFRSSGGSDDPANIGSLCLWCHLYGVHGGRIRASGTAEHIRWELGAAGSLCLVVDGRERLAA